MNGYYTMRDPLGGTRQVYGDDLLPQDDSHLFEDEPNGEQDAAFADAMLACQEDLADVARL